MYIWRHIPLLRFLIPYALGIHFASAVLGYFSFCHETVIQKRSIVIKLDKMRHFFAQSIVI